MTDGITYDPTRDHWTPYEPWMRHVLADDARASWAVGGTEDRSTWDIYRRRTDLWAAGVDLRIHPNDVPDLLAHVDHLTAELATARDEVARLRAGIEELTWESTGDNRLGQPTGRWVGPIEVRKP